jgi:hypothetical protein
MELLNILKHLVFISPVRCGRTFFQCSLQEVDDTNIVLIFTPTNQYTKIDPRRENESSMPEHVNRFEEWEHAGLSVGSIEYFLNEHNIPYSVTTSDKEIFVRVSNNNFTFSGSLDKYETLKHSQRSFNTDTPVDVTTLKIINELIDTFLIDNSGHKVVITDPKVREIMYSLAIYWEGEGKPGNIHIPQMNAPLIISIPPKQFDVLYYFQMGRVYSRIGLTALDRGYQLAFCNSFNYFSEKIKPIEDILHLKYGEYTVDTLIPQSFICIGTALDKHKPYNWVAEHSMIKTSDTHLSPDFISVR